MQSGTRSHLRSHRMITGLVGRDLDRGNPMRSYRSGIVWLMPRGNPSPKLAITVDPDVHAQVVAAAAAEGVSVSAWMTAAARRALRLREGLAAVAEWEAEHGALTGEELEAARRRAGSLERRSA